MKNKIKKAKVESLKKELLLSNKEFEEEFFIALNAELFFGNEKKLKSELKKHKKVINAIDKKIDINKIFKQVHTISSR